MPRVSIGLPVCNGERFLPGALASLLAQDFRDFELIVCDNASTDGTERIVRAARDPRVRFERNARNTGAIANFNRAFALASAPYFMWAAHDDEWAPSYVRKCVEALDAHPDASLACSSIRWIDEAGRPIGPFDDNVDTRGMTLRERVRALLSRSSWFQIYGLIRSDALRRTRLVQPVWGPDVVLTLELALQGTFVKVEEPLFRYRIVQEKESALAAPGAGRRKRAPAYRDLVPEVMSLLPPDLAREARATILKRNPWLCRMAAGAGARAALSAARRGRVLDAARALGAAVPFAGALALRLGASKTARK